MIVLLRGDRALVVQAERAQVEDSTRLLFGRFANELQSVTLSLKTVVAADGTPAKRHASVRAVTGRDLGG